MFERFMGSCIVVGMGFCLMVAACGGPETDEPGPKLVAAGSPTTMRPSGDAYINLVDGINSSGATVTTNLYQLVDEATQNGTTDYVRSLYNSSSQGTYTSSYSNGPSGTVTDVVIHAYVSKSADSTGGTVQLNLVDSSTSTTYPGLSQNFTSGTFLELTEHFSGLSISSANSLRTKVYLNNNVAAGSIRMTQIYMAVTTGVSLRWPAPTSSNWHTINLTTGNDDAMTYDTPLNDSWDYILVMPAQKKTRSLKIKGGHHIKIVGGYISNSVLENNGIGNIRIDDGANATPGRIVHIEGVLIDGTGGVDCDGIDLKAPNAIVQIQHVRIVGLTGSLSNYHADCIQPWGGMQELRVDTFTCSSAYNSLYFRRETHYKSMTDMTLVLDAEIGMITMSNANMIGVANSTHDPNETIAGISWGTQGLSGAYPGNSQSDLPVNCRMDNDLNLSNFYIAPYSKAFGEFTYPDVNAGGGMCCYAVVNGSQLSWHGMSSSPNCQGSAGKITGAVTQGPPPNGDFCDTNCAGLGYTD
jgi:hypothetical protein